MIQRNESQLKVLRALFEQQVELNYQKDPKTAFEQTARFFGVQDLYTEKLREGTPAAQQKKLQDLIEAETPPDFPSIRNFEKNSGELSSPEFRLGWSAHRRGGYMDQKEIGEVISEFRKGLEARNMYYVQGAGPSLPELSGVEVDPPQKAVELEPVPVEPPKKREAAISQDALPFEHFFPGATTLKEDKLAGPKEHLARLRHSARMIVFQFVGSGCTGTRNGLEITDPQFFVLRDVIQEEMVKGEFQEKAEWFYISRDSRDEFADLDEYLRSMAPEKPKKEEPVVTKELCSTSRVTVTSLNEEMSIQLLEDGRKAEEEKKKRVTHLILENDSKEKRTKKQMTSNEIRALISRMDTSRDLSWFLEHRVLTAQYQDARTGDVSNIVLPSTLSRDGRFEFVVCPNRKLPNNEGVKSGTIRIFQRTMKSTGTGKPIVQKLPVSSRSRLGGPGTVDIRYDKIDYSVALVFAELLTREINQDSRKIMSRGFYEVSSKTWGLSSTARVLITSNIGTIDHIIGLRP